jgi:hypothetical protein
MAKDRFFIAPYNNDSGLQADVKPWLIPDQAFAELTNAYVFRGRVRKRFGSRWLGNSQLQTRFRINIATTNGAGNTPAGTFVPNIAGTPIATPAIGQMFSVGNDLFTVNALGNPANLLRSDGLAAVATFDTTTGAVDIQGATPATTVYYYPALPVMGLKTLEQVNISNERIIGFDTRFAYEYNAGWERLAGQITANAARWIGSDSQFFWTCTWTGANAFDRIFFVTNFNQAELNFMRFFNGTNWDNFRPALTAAGTTLLDSSRILVPFKNRLLAFNTYETEPAVPGPGTVQRHYANRMRFSQVGSPLAATAWVQDTPGLGGGRDCPTMESIIAVEFVRDRLIVFCESSTWEIVYTGNQVDPFVWQQINTELGAESTFSIVPFDRVAIGVGNVGIHACNGINVERIDAKIPDEVFSIHNIDAGVERVYGIRDYSVEMIYWALPSVTSDATFPFPNRVLVYNYATGTWAINHDSITVFGQFQDPIGVLWSSTTITWDDTTTWGGGFIQAQARQVIAGNTQGYTFIIDSTETTNASVLQITDITVVTVGTFNAVTCTVVNHNLRTGEYIYLEGIVDAGNLGATLNNTIQTIVATPSANTFIFAYDDGATILAGAYQGAGLISRVSNINIKTKQYNFYASTGRDAAVSQINFLVDSTTHGQITVDYLTNSDDTGTIAGAGPNGTNMLLGNNVLETSPYLTEPAENWVDRLWHPVYFNAEGNLIQFQLTLSDVQLRDVNVRGADFQLHAMCIIATPSRNRLQ